MAGRDAVLQIILKAKDDAVATIKALDDALEDMGESTEKTSKKSGDLFSQLKKLAAAAVVAKTIAMTVELVKLGARAEQVRNTFENLGGTTGGLEAISEATRGMVSNVDAMAAANQFLAMGIAENTDEVARLAEMATQLGLAMDTGPTEAMGAFAAMMANQSIESLDRFGISSGVVRTRITEMMAATQGMTREAAFTAATLEQGAVAMERVGEQSGGTAGEMAVVGAELENVKAMFGEMMAAALSASGVLGAVVEGLESIQALIQQSSEAMQSTADIEGSLAGLRETGALTADEFARMTSEAQLLGYGFQTNQITAEEYATALENLRLQANEMAGIDTTLLVNTEMLTSALGEELDVLRTIADQALPIATESVGNFSAIMGEFAEEMSGEIGPSIYDAYQQLAADVPDALADLAAAYGEHVGAMEEITAEGAEQREEITFQHQLDLAQAQGEYQAEHAELVARGDQEAADNLTAKHQSETDMTTVQYQQQLGLTDRSLLKQRIAEQKSYIKGLKIQQDATIRKLRAMVLEAASADGIVSAREQAL